jgi:4'-phosphopantetheinyl transferase EntD
MTTAYLIEETTIIAMTKALKPLSDDYLQFRQARFSEYRKAQINEHHITLFDSTAYRREVMRRMVMGSKRGVAA